MNPYLNQPKSQLITASGSPIENGGKEVPRAVGYTRTGALVQSEYPMVAGNSEFNVGGLGKRYTTKDTIAIMKQMQHDITSGVLGKKTSQEVRATRLNKFKQAFADRSGNQMKIIGETIGENIYESLGREGFARKVLQFRNVKDGETIRHKIVRKDIGGVASANDPLVTPNIVKQDYMYPEEFYLLSNILIEDKEIKQSGEDILEDKYNTGLEAILTAEDRVLYNMLRTSSSMSHDELYYATLTPTIFSTMRSNIMATGNHATNCIFSFDLWDDVLTDTEFGTWFDPVSKYNLVSEGTLGSLMGVTLITDGYRLPNLRVLGTGEIFMLADMRSLGTISERQALKSTPIDRYNVGEPKRGWFLETIESIAIGNPLGVIHGQRV